MTENESSYDARLFQKGLRKRIHESRFHWLRAETSNLSGSVLELGCYNARSLDYLGFSPSEYLGLDADWEDGLVTARAKYPQYNFKKSSDPNDISGNWDIAIALETLEHLPRPEILDTYLRKMAESARMLIATVPMEIGPLFSAKFLYKKFIHRYKSKYTFSEFVNQSLGRSHLVRQDNHQGFDYRKLVDLISKYYNIEKVEGVNRGFPRLLNTQIGIVAKSKLFERHSIS